MSWRTVVITNQAKLDYKMGMLVVRSTEVKKIYIDEISVLVLENPMISLTGCLLEVLVEKKVKVIFCDSRRNPIAELTPHHGSYDSSAKIRSQFTWPEEIKAMVWQEIVCEKIRMQSDFLGRIGRTKESELLKSYISQIEPLDFTNREGHAAKVYFNSLFGMEFTRSLDCPINAALNYGYSIILSAFNREISSNGYLTQLGIFHSNMFNHFNLACDFMEPFRIIVDRFVYEINPQKFDKEEKHLMWNIMKEEVMIDNGKQSILNAIKIYCKSVLDSINDGDISKIKHYYFLENSYLYERI